MFINVDRALNYLFPPVCGICGKYNNTYLCQECKKNVTAIEEDKCLIYKGGNIKEHFWLFKYEGIIRLKLIDYKFNDKSYLFRMFCEMICNSPKAMQYLEQMDYIVPVPIHKKRYMERGYNQCSLIAKKICKKLNVQLLDGILIKNKNIVPQSTLNKNERKINIIGSYSAKEYYDLSGKKVAIFDDIFTTGSTINECSNVIKSLGCKNIYAFTIAKD